MATTDRAFASNGLASPSRSVSRAWSAGGWPPATGPAPGGRGVWVRHADTVDVRLIGITGSARLPRAALLEEPDGQRAMTPKLSEAVRTPSGWRQATEPAGTAPRR